MPAIFVNPISEFHLDLLNELNVQNQDLRVFVSENQPREFIEKIPGKKAIGDIKDYTHISTACQGAFCSIYFENDSENLREVFTNSIKSSNTSRIIWVSNFEPSDEILKIKNLIYVLTASDSNYKNIILELENAVIIDTNFINLKNI